MALRNVHLGGMALLGALTIMASSSTRVSTNLYGAKSPGDYLPRVTITDERTTIDVGLQEAELILIHFWAAYNAESRAQRVAYEGMLRKPSLQGIAYRPISLDVDADVYAQTLTFDDAGAISTDDLIVDLDKRSRLMELCGLTEGMHSYLIDQEGKILKVDPTAEELEQSVRN